MNVIRKEMKGRDILRDGAGFSRACCRTRDDDGGPGGGIGISISGETNRILEFCQYTKEKQKFHFSI